MIIVKVNDIYGSLLVTKVEDKKAWCRCKCGAEVITTTAYLFYGKIVACSDCSKPIEDTEEIKISARRTRATEQIIDDLMYRWCHPTTRSNSNHLQE